MTLRGIFLILAFVTFLPSAHAKQVKLEWEEIDGSTGYELEIAPLSGDGKTRKAKRKGTKWEGNVPFGVYIYRVRAIDRAERPGDWTEVRPLVVLPTSPTPLAPGDGAKLSLLEKSDPKILKWEPIAAASEYKLEIKKKGQLVESTTVTGTSYDAKSLGPGDYSWTVRAVVKAPSRAPASIRGKQWEAEASDASDFKVEYKELATPDVISPQGAIMPTADGRLAFHWKRVPQAKSYEITLEKDELSGKAATFRVANNHMTTVVKDLGVYRWRVRAIASATSMEAATSESRANFEVSSTGFGHGRGYIGLSGMYSPYTYGIKNGNIQGNLDSTSATLRVAGELFIKGRWGAGAGIQNTSVTIQGQNYGLKDLDAYVKYRLHLGRVASGWTLLPKFGIETRQYIFLSPKTDPGGQVTTVADIGSTMGPSIGFDLRKQINAKWSVGIKFAHYRPIKMSGLNGSMTGDSSNRNMSAGIQGFYWYGPRWGLGLGTFIDRRSLSYVESMNGTAISVNMDATHLFGSLLFRF